MATNRKIIHIDMDCFFAAVEQRDNPELRGKPIAVGHDGERGVVATASYEARRYGVHSAMSSIRAHKLCPDLIFVASRFDIYKEVSAQIHKIFREYTDIIEPISLDEAFLDVTENKPNIDLAVNIAIEIKQKINNRLNLVASAGISYNKFLAKIASDWRKPDGLCTIHPLQAEEFISNLKIEKFWGVGPVTAKRMHSLGIHTGKQLREQSLDRLTAEFGKSGLIYYNFARGIDNRAVESSRIRHSVGCEHTLNHDIDRHMAIIIELYHVADELTQRIEQKSFKGFTLTLKIKFDNFRQITRSLSVNNPICELNQILTLSKHLLSLIELNNNRIRLIGLTVSNPAKENTDCFQLLIPDL